MSRTRGRLLLALKTAVALVLIAAVGWRFGELLGSSQLWDRPIPVRLGYLVPAGLLYLTAHTLWGTFFVFLLRSQGAKVPWRIGVRAYFVSQFGKYVPGKAGVILLRVTLLRQQGASAAVVGVSATYETLTSMAAGAAVAVCLLPWAGLDKLTVGETVYRLDVGSWEWVALAGVAVLPLVLGGVNRVVAVVARRRRGPDARPLPSPPVWLLACGLLQAAVGWCFLGLSIWLTVQGLSADSAGLSADSYLGATEAATASYVAGFVVLVSPSGLGVRELILQQMLRAQLVPAMGEPAAAFAALVAVVSRLVWTVAEVGCAALFWVLVRPRPTAHPLPLPVPPPVAVEKSHG